jgi:hypothetical protein
VRKGNALPGPRFVVICRSDRSFNTWDEVHKYVRSKRYKTAKVVDRKYREIWGFEDGTFFRYANGKF